MSGVCDDDRTVRADLLLRRGTSIRRGIQTTVQTETGGPFAPLDMSGWTGVFVLSSPSGVEWWRTSVSCTRDGWTIVDVQSTAFSPDVWNDRKTGVWRIEATAPDGHVERVGEGYANIN
jgi:hypothetical protein